MSASYVQLSNNLAVLSEMEFLLMEFLLMEKWMNTLRKCRFIQSVRAELVEAFANILIYIGNISTNSM